MDHRSWLDNLNSVTSVLTAADDSGVEDKYVVEIERSCYDMILVILNLSKDATFVLNIKQILNKSKCLFISEIPNPEVQK